MANNQVSIQILCEGYEEKAYIDKILGMPTIRHDIYYFYPTINCKSISRIFARFQDIYSQNIAQIIIVFCDADKCSDDFKELLSKIDNCLFGGKPVSSKVVVFGNPVTMQIVLSHFASVSLTSKSKVKNQPIIQSLTGISHYQAHDEQINEMISQINFGNFNTMKSNLAPISTDVTVVPSSNFLDFLNSIENENLEWCEEIIKLMKGGG